MSASDSPVINAQGIIFSNEKDLQAWEAWAKARVEEGLRSPSISHEEAKQRIQEAIKDVQRKMV